MKNKQENIVHFQEIKVLDKTLKYLEVAYEDFKAIMNTVLSNVKENILEMNEKIGNRSEIETYKRNKQKSWN